MEMSNWTVPVAETAPTRPAVKQADDNFIATVTVTMERMRTGTGEARMRIEGTRISMGINVGIYGTSAAEVGPKCWL